MKGALHYLHFALPFSIFLVRSHLSGYPLANRHFALLPRSNTKCEVWGFQKWQFYLDGGFRLVFKRPDRPLIWILCVTATILPPNLPPKFAQKYL